MGSIGSMVQLDNRISCRRDLLTSVQGSHDTLLALYLMISGPHECSNCTSLSQTSMWLQTVLSRLAGQSILNPLINLENAEVKVPKYQYYSKPREQNPSPSSIRLEVSFAC